MQFTEKLLHCYNCQKPFIFTVEAQKDRSSQGYPNDPTNCPICRRARKTRTSIQTLENKNYNSHQQLYPVTCSQCRKAIQVSFKPRSDKPFYCSDCQKKIRAKI
jgi:CxxC-x17-CxxC domain-containing protein